MADEAGGAATDPGEGEGRSPERTDGTGGRVTIEIEAGTTNLTLAVGDDGRLHQLGFGSGLPGVDQMLSTFPVGLHPLAYPTFGEEPLREPALRVVHADGATSTRLRFVSATQEAHELGVDHRIELVDRVAPLAVVLCFRTWPTYDLLEQWVEVENRGDADIVVHELAATAPALGARDPHLTHWTGGWAGEWTEVGEHLTPGTKLVTSGGGVRPSLHLPPLALISLDGPATETAGSVGACTVVWGGDTRIAAEVAAHAQVRVLAGHQTRGAERVLGPGERFSAPHALWVWSDEGVGPTSRALHRYAREQVVRGGTALRATVANTWEAVGFALDDDRLGALVDASADVGAELFLLDDGWFGGTYPRNDDLTSLGDWTVDRTKLPNGLQPLIDRTLDRGMRFGLWVEPEMVNPTSELYRDHPDWVIAEPGRERREERNQLVLDLLHPDAWQFAFDVVDRVLNDHPQISYLKWDANRDLTEPGSLALAPDRQSHLPVDRVRATMRLMERVAVAHPEVELMACASGGGRSDLATMAWFHELWTSDDTDPVDRVRIQWGASHLLPASVVAAHVTHWGLRPIPFGCAVAMSGRFGFDLDLGALSEPDLTVCRDAAAAYQDIRDLVQQGDLHRLVSPIGSDRGALAYLDGTGDRAVVFAYVLPSSEAAGAAVPAAIELPWLQADLAYDVVDLTPGGDGSAALTSDRRLPWPDADAPAATVVVISRAGPS